MISRLSAPPVLEELKTYMQAQFVSFHQQNQDNKTKNQQRLANEAIKLEIEMER